MKKKQQKPYNLPPYSIYKLEINIILSTYFKPDMVQWFKVLYKVFLQGYTRFYTRYYTRYYTRFKVLYMCILVFSQCAPTCVDSGTVIIGTSCQHNLTLYNPSPCSLHYRLSVVCEFNGNDGYSVDSTLYKGTVYINLYIV